MPRTRFLHAAVACLLVAVPSVARGQAGETNGRVFSSLFGGATSSRDGQSAVDFNAALFGGYDDDLLTRGSGNTPRPVDQRLSGSFVGGQASLAYRHRLPRGGFSVRAQTMYRYLSEQKELLPTYHSAGFGVLHSFNPRTRLTFRQRMAYRPFFSVVPFATGATIGPSVESEPGLDAPVDDDLGGDPGGDFSLASSREAVTYGGTAILTRDLSQRAEFNYAARYAAANFLAADVKGFNNLRWGVSGTYTYRMSDYLGLRLGYGYRRFEAREGPDTDNHDINVGVLYNQPFVLGRGRTTLSFTTGSTMLVREAVDDTGTSRDRFVWRALGTATLTHDFAGPWQAQLSYVRSVGFLDGLNDAFMGDRVVASLGGLLGQRTDVLFTGGYVSGSFGLRERNFDTAIAGARIRTALTRHLALFAQYFFYQYRFDETVAEDLFLPGAQERQGLRAGLTVWVPLLRR